jgi:hypothetical protein
VIQQKVFLITSGAYVNSELASDFGLLPTSFLPVGHKRLFELQLELIKGFNGEKHISIPENYELLDRDLKILSKYCVQIFKSSSKISLKDSILEFLNNQKLESISEFYILHGDTLYSKLDYATDLMYCNFTNMFYKWGNLQEIIEPYDSKFKDSIVSGYFSFKDIGSIKLALENSTDFVSSLKKYNNDNPFNLKIGDNWLDFGHSNLYYKSKVKLNVTRYFNKTEAKLNYIQKSSLDKQKIINEFNWFYNLPNEISYYSPSVWDLDCDNASYKIEFLGSPTLQEKWVFGNLPDKFFLETINDIFNLINKMHSHEYECDLVSKKSILKILYIEKTEHRLSNFISESKFNPNINIIINDVKYPTLNEFKNEVFGELNNRIDNITKSGLGIMHGDLCFSNILLDNRSNSIKIIDPRGSLVNNDLSGNNMGDYAYDVLKMGHSLIGNYDFIVTGFYDLECDLNHYIFDFKLAKHVSDELSANFYDNAEKLGLNKSFVKSGITNLFLSMLPLHKESKERQFALLINAYKFYYN